VELAGVTCASPWYGARGLASPSHHCPFQAPHLLHHRSPVLLPLCPCCFGHRRWPEHGGLQPPSRHHRRRATFGWPNPAILPQSTRGKSEVTLVWLISLERSPPTSYSSPLGAALPSPVFCHRRVGPSCRRTRAGRIQPQARQASRAARKRAGLVAVRFSFLFLFLFSFIFSQIWILLCKIHISCCVDPNEVIPIVLGSVWSVVFRKNIKCICVILILEELNGPLKCVLK
jgi:hypothetical protein